MKLTRTADSLEGQFLGAAFGTPSDIRLRRVK
jgi:hypothetical protein